MIDRFLGDAFGVLSCSFWVLSCSATDTHLKLLDRVVSGARFLTMDVFECDIAHRLSMAVLCMLYKKGVTQCTIFMIRYLCRMCGLQAVL